MHITFGPIDVTFGNMRVRKGSLWIPDGLHIWLGSRGMHAFWNRSPYMRRITFDK